MEFDNILNKFRDYSNSNRQLGTNFEELMARFLKVYGPYKSKVKNIWLWNEFPYKTQFSGNDTGIDLVIHDFNDDFIAVQCKCYQKETKISKEDLDTFISTSGKEFNIENDERKIFSSRLFIFTTNELSKNAKDLIENQTIPIQTISLNDLENAEVDWESLLKGDKVKIKKKIPLEHQQEAIARAVEYYKTADRGKMIMACGTGKTFTSLKIAETLAQQKVDLLHTHTHTHTRINSFNCLFLVPSIALVKQTLTEWTAQNDYIDYICICSDPKASNYIEDDSSNDLSNLSFPATTNSNTIIESFKKIILKRKNSEDENVKNGMIVIFSTYQSIDVISKVQKQISNDLQDFNLNFDLIICDEAHRTTGITVKGKDETDFVKVHDNNFISADKRLYMTATPKIYIKKTKTKEKQGENREGKENREDNNENLKFKNIDDIYSMDDENIYGKEFYKIGFGEAVDRGLLSDYKVFILATTDENFINEDIRNKLIETVSGEFKKIKEDTIIENSVKLIGSINGISKKCLTREDAEFIRSEDPESMKKVVCFTNTIENSKIVKKILNSYYDLFDKNVERNIEIKAEHIDETIDIYKRNEDMDWLKKSKQDGECRILTNVRCLSEGVDVPSLDGIIFLSPKVSKIDIVQSVGRVMRKAEGKKYGYIIVPIFLPKGSNSIQELESKDTGCYSIVWDVLNALKAHDDRLVNEVNIGNLGTNNETKGKKRIFIESLNSDGKVDAEFSLKLDSKFKDILYVRLKDRNYWPKWSANVARVAKENVDKIQKLIGSNEKYKNEFNKLVDKLHREINPTVKESEVIEMLAQHSIMEPIFKALFNNSDGNNSDGNNSDIMSKNPIAKNIDKLTKLLSESDGESLQLKSFVDNVVRCIKGVETKEQKQNLIKELYNNFFKEVFKDISSKLGIVYTPIEVVDFIINSVNDIVKKEFGKTLGDNDINIIDPFTGTGTFITRLLHFLDGRISKNELKRKYLKEIFANEINLIAYYTACANIETEFNDIYKEEYLPFNGLCLTDTFQLYEGESEQSTKEDMEFISDELDNNERIKKQKRHKINIILGNPPYSVGQKSANDDNQNQHYKKLENKIRNTYVKYSTAQKTSMYDSYIKAFRWSTDRLNENDGIIGFITNSGWLDSGSADGFRKCLLEDFSSIYIIDLKGNIRKFDNKEGENIFNVMTGVAIVILIKNSKTKGKNIYYYNIGDYLKREEKLARLKNLKSCMNEVIEYKEIIPNKYNDWLNQRGELFENEDFIPIEADKKYNADTKSFFVNYSLGIKTARDVWCYNFSKKELEENVNTTINYYNQQRIEVNENGKKLIKDSKKCNWAGNWDKYLKNNKIIIENKDSYFEGMYRPFCKQNVYFNEYLNERVYQMPSIFPKKDSKNICICISGLASSKDFSCLMSDCVLLIIV